MSYLTLLHIIRGIWLKGHSLFFDFPLLTKIDLTYHLKDFLEPSSSLC